MGKIILAVIVVALVFWYVCMPVSKKRFLKELLRQVPYLIPRYFV
ncbi:MAG: hypothetical protein PHY31_04700 [Smithellaceae bacterium]|nr:hypothetical protein [Smithellaceae bacterium]